MLILYAQIINLERHKQGSKESYFEKTRKFTSKLTSYRSLNSIKSVSWSVDRHDESNIPPYKYSRNTLNNAGLVS